MPSLEEDIKKARSGFISNTPTHHFETGSGFAPYQWFGDDAVAATAPWTNAPIGSTYILKTSESAEPTFYHKKAAAGTVADWWIVNSTQGSGLQIKKIPVADLTANVKDTGWDLPANSIVLDVFVHVTTLEATATTKTIDVGLLASESGGDEDGFLDGGITSAAAVVRGGVTVTTGSNTKFFAATPTRGAFLADHQAGSDVDQDEGVYREKPHIATAVTAKSVTYTLGSAHTELVANIYVVYWLFGM